MSETGRPEDDPLGVSQKCVYVDFYMTACTNGRSPHCQQACPGTCELFRAHGEKDADYFRRLKPPTDPE